LTRAENGNKLIAAFAILLNQTFGAEVPKGRLVGGEYAIAVNGNALLAKDAAKKIQKLTEKPLVVSDALIVVTCSIGVAIYPEHGALERLTEHAALAMRTIKIAGGRDFCIFDHQMGRNIRDQYELINDLRKALELNQFELYFQPKVDADSLKFTAAEALIRWHHPERGFISPGYFIPLAEKFGLMGPIGRWVIEQACKTGAHWKSRGLRMRVAVNISGSQMREEDLVEYIEMVTNNYGISGQRFTCEITESVAMEDTKITLQTFEKMRNARFHVSIDDFGTGYSSLALLRKLPAAELKIDRAFVTELVESEDAQSIVRSIIGLGKSLNLRIVAEGIETLEQCQMLVQMGCDELQGYLFAMPMPAQQLEELAFDFSSRDHPDFRRSLFEPTNMSNL
jgi:EAL domain-containing protein (putative c-di-GMP-specific phosphodiesterase class I)